MKLPVNMTLDADISHRTKLMEGKLILNLYLLRM
jgi:hypothetical protein